MMARGKYLAHISTDGREQTVAEHLTGASARCAQFASAFGAEAQGRLAGLAHDIGKYSETFQKRLQGGPPVDHSTAGAFECCALRQNYAAFAVAGHHGGLPDGGTKQDGPDEPTLCGRLRKASIGKLDPCDAWKKEIRLPSPPLPPFSTPLEAMFFTRMLYSCLVDADFLDTEEFMMGAPVPKRSGETIEVLEKKLNAHISRWSSPENGLNEQRCAILNRCLEQGEQQQLGLFTLTVPTGGGKTVASLAFALRHARAHGLRRVIYVIPYTSIIEQNAQVFRDILGAENVLEHHSGLLYDMENEADPKQIQLARATENWDKPVVVTTAVQFFESLYACRSSQCRKLHNIAGSVIIFDEAQMLPLPYLRPCVFAMAQLVKHYHASAVLCTATQPSLGALFREFLPDKPMVELCPPGICQGSIFRRVVFRREGVLDNRALAQRLNALPQVLCVVNRRMTAQEVFRLLDGESSFHLSTLMYPAHRKTVLEEIKERLKKGLPCRVVSTSLIEAGVDVDFPAVFREEAGLDSILQAAGRCNREGKRQAEESIVTIFRGETPPPSLFDIPVAAGREALNRYKQPDSPEAIRCYFQELLDLKGSHAQDQKDILRLMEQELMPFRKVADRFHLIDSETKTVYIPLGEGQRLIARLRAGERGKALFRALGQYGVSVYPQHFAELDRAGALELLEDGSAILADLDHYQIATGLKMDITGGIAHIL